MRKPRSRVRRNFTENFPGSEEFARLIEECSIEKEIIAEFERKGKSFKRLDPETRRAMICEKLM